MTGTTIENYFAYLLQHAASEPIMSAKQKLRANTLCNFLSSPELGLTDSRKFLRCDVELILKLQRGVKLVILTQCFLLYFQSVLQLIFVVFDLWGRIHISIVCRSQVPH